MKTTERMNMVLTMTEGVSDSLKNFCEVKNTKGYTPSAGYDLPREDSKESIKRRIMVIREELLTISKEL